MSINMEIVETGESLRLADLIPSLKTLDSLRELVSKNKVKIPGVGC